MILKRMLTTVIVGIGLIHGISCASYSKVYVHSGAEVNPYSYSYGAPAVTYNSQLSRLSSSPIGSVVPLPQAASFVTPCVPAPCVPTQPIAPVPNAGLIAYKAPSVPVVVTQEEPANYEYAYVVYDENTGDQKTLKELSDGSVVRGQYSLLQPDGYVREVTYTADDLTGFNAIVKNFLPKGEIKTIKIKPKVDCEDQKLAALKENPKPKEDAHGEPSKPSDGAKASAGEATTLEKPKEAQSTPAQVEADHGEKGQEKTPPSSTKAPQVEVITAKVKEEKAPIPAGHGQETVAEHAKHAEPEKPKSHADETVAEHANHAIIQPVQLPQGVVIDNPEPISYSTYTQLMRCIQAMKNSDQRVNSPLSYIILPTSSWPC